MKVTINMIENNNFLHFGDHRILDFCNTLVFHTKKKEDRLSTIKEIKSFFKEFYLVEKNITKANFEEILWLRTILRDFFDQFLTQEKVSFKKINLFLKNHALVLHVFNDKDSGSPGIGYRSKDAINFLILDFFDLLNNHSSKRIKTCANDNCSHFFYDRSKNNSRVWCSMKSCGNLMKARAFKARRK